MAARFASLLSVLVLQSLAAVEAGRVVEIATAEQDATVYGAKASDFPSPLWPRAISTATGSATWC